MIRPRMLSPTWFTVLGSLALLACGSALADPPGRVARLSQMSGAVSFSPAGEEDWVAAQPNRPLITGDRVWADANSRAEVQIGNASARLGSSTAVTLLNLDDRTAQIQLAQGTLHLRVRRVYADQVFEIDAPNLAFSVRRPGDYRLDVDPAGNTTVIRVRSGEGEAWGEGAAYTVAAGQQYTFAGDGLRDYSVDALPGPDQFDTWNVERDRREEAATASRYVSADVVGYSDLEEYGSWRSVPEYGNVWFPTSVAADYVPYREGHWAWVDPWGWTWVDDAPWGFAPFHYGRWAYVSTRWCWVPGPLVARPVYAPALVAFIGGGGFSLSISTGPVAGIAWFPLGPGEVYRPGYAASREYFNSVNVSNTVVNTTVINNVYNNTNVTNIVYRNREAPGAVTAVPTAAFASAEPVARHAVPMTRDMIARQAVTPVAAVAPSHASVLAVAAVGAAAGAAAVAIAKRPPPAALARPVVAKTAPPPPPPSFAAKASLLAAQPGKPLEPEKLKTVSPARPPEAKVKVVAPTVTPQPLTKQSAGNKGAPAAAAPAPTPAGAAKGPQPPLKEVGKGTPPPAAAVPQPPASAQERMLKESKGPPPEPKGPQQPQKDMSKGPAPAAAVPQPPASAQERMLKESAKGPPPAPPKGPQQPPKEMSKGPAPAAAVPQPPASAQERMLKENKGPAPAAAAPQPPAKFVAPAPPPPKVAAPPPPPPPKVAAPPPPPPPPPKAAAPPPPPVQKAAPPPPPKEEGKSKEKEKEKAKEGQ